MPVGFEWMPPFSKRSRSLPSSGSPAMPSRHARDRKTFKGSMPMSALVKCPAPDALPKNPALRPCPAALP